MFKSRRHFKWHARAFDIDLGRRTLIMGVVNVTADSFSGDGVLARYGKEKIPGLAHALELIKSGADIIDVGGESSRPGAVAVEAIVEAARVVPLIKALARQTNIPVSVDTYKPFVARQALVAGASAVNLIKGTSPKAPLLRLIKKFDAGLILMHMRGNALTMQRKTRYTDVVADVKRELKEALTLCRSCGIKRSSIVIDPGIGFSKTAEQSLLILRRLDEFCALGYPILTGTSRKSFIGKVLGADVNERSGGTAATVACCAASGAHIVRVHDVELMKQVALVTDAILTA